MKKIYLSIVAILFFASLHAVAVVKTYQVTGPVLEVNDTKIVIQKGDDKWEIARDANTKVNGKVKVGSKVTIEYTMAAKTVEAKSEK